jgi:hypothetical protein
MSGRRDRGKTVTEHSSKRETVTKLRSFIISKFRTHIWTIDSSTEGWKVNEDSGARSDQSEIHDSVDRRSLATHLLLGQCKDPTSRVGIRQQMEESRREGTIHSQIDPGSGSWLKVGGRCSITGEQLAGPRLIMLDQA